MPTAMTRQPDAPVVVAVAEDDVHRPRPDEQQPERHGAGEGGDGQDGDADRAGEGLVALGGLQPAEVGQQRGLDRLEELQRRARDEQRVEDDAGQRASVAVALTVSTDALSSACSASWIAGHRQREAGARAQRQRALVDRGRRVGRGVPHDRPRHDQQRGQRRGEDAQRDGGLPVGEARPRPRPGSRSATPTRRARGRRRARTTGARRGSRGRSSWPRRRASRRRGPSTASPSVEGVLDRALAARARRRGRRPRSRAWIEQRRCAAGAGRDGRARGGRRSCATAAARPAGR